MCKVEDREGMNAENIGTIKRKPNILYRKKKKNALKVSQEFARPCS